MSVRLTLLKPDMPAQQHRQRRVSQSIRIPCYDAAPVCTSEAEVMPLCIPQTLSLLSPPLSLSPPTLLQSEISACTAAGEEGHTDSGGICFQALWS